MTKKLWEEFGPKWPEAFWDDWVREPQQKLGRDCIHPEISRTYTFGAEGASHGQFYQENLASIKLNDVPVKFEELDLSYLLKDNWNKHFASLLQAASVNVINSISEISAFSGENLTLYYNTYSEFRRIGNQLKIMTDLKAGIPRTGYEYVVIVWVSQNNRLFIRPTKDYKTPPPE